MGQLSGLWKEWDGISSFPLEEQEFPSHLGILRYQSAVLNFCFHRFAFIKDPEGRAELILTAF